MIANLPLVLPMSAGFKRYHSDHHRYLGHNVHDVDVPTETEAKLFCTTFGKLCWVFLQPFFYYLRPPFKNPKDISNHEIINIVIQFIADLLIIHIFGWKMFFYLIASGFLSTSLHPLGGERSNLTIQWAQRWCNPFPAQYISEHYMFHKDYETYSYYGPLNVFMFNLGYHK